MRDGIVFDDMVFLSGYLIDERGKGESGIGNSPARECAVGSLSRCFFESRSVFGILRGDLERIFRHHRASPDKEGLPILPIQMAGDFRKSRPSGEGDLVGHLRHPRFWSRRRRLGRRTMHRRRAECLSNGKLPIGGALFVERCAHGFDRGDEAPGRGCIPPLADRRAPIASASAGNER